jgi:hypothetical protein
MTRSAIFTTLAVVAQGEHPVLFDVAPGPARVADSVN